jgi:hypothetical protein
LIRLVGDRQCRDFQLLPGLQGQQVGALLVLVRENKVARAGLQRVAHVLLEILAGLDRRGVGAECFSLRAYVADRAINRGLCRRDGCAALESAGGDCRKAKACAVEVYAGDVQRTRPVLVEEHLQIISGEQVDAVVGSVASQLIDLGEQGVVVALQRGARGACSGDGGGGEPERRLIGAGEREA